MRRHTGFDWRIPGLGVATPWGVLGESAAVTNLGIAPSGDVWLSSQWLAFMVSEAAQGEDLNGDGSVAGHVSDAIAYLGWAFLGGPPLPPPFPRCGTSLDPKDHALGCELPADCP